MPKCPICSTQFRFFKKLEQHKLTCKPKELNETEKKEAICECIKLYVKSFKDYIEFLNEDLQNFQKAIFKLLDIQNFDTLRIKEPISYKIEEEDLEVA